MKDRGWKHNLHGGSNKIKLCLMGFDKVRRPLSSTLNKSKEKTPINCWKQREKNVCLSL